MISIATGLFPLSLLPSQLDVEARKKHGHAGHDHIEAEKRRKKKKKRKPKPPPTPPVVPPPSPPSPPVVPPPPCAALHQTCSNNCCGTLGCGNNGCDSGSVCYRNPGSRCSASCDCRF